MPLLVGERYAIRQRRRRDVGAGPLLAVRGGGVKEMLIGPPVAFWNAMLTPGLAGLLFGGSTWLGLLLGVGAGVGGGDGSPTAKT